MKPLLKCADGPSGRRRVRIDDSAVKQVQNTTRRARNLAA